MATTKKPYAVQDFSPDVFNDNEIWRNNTGANPARYLINPGRVTAPGRHSAGSLRHARPYIVSGNVIFVFPLGIEGFSRVGAATLGLHRYIGANAVDAQTIMREEGRITLTGIFPGNTAQDAMVACENVLRSTPPTPGLTLYAPGVFDMEQYVTAENWEFTHDAEDRSHSINYSITFVRTGEGKRVSDPHGVPAPVNPTVVRKKAQTPAKTFTVKSGVQTLRAVAKAVYGSSDEWQRLVTLNSSQIALFQRSNALNAEFKGLPTYSLPTYRWPIGTRFKY